MDPRSIACKLHTCNCPQGAYGVHLPAQKIGSPPNGASVPARENKNVQWSTRENSIIPRKPTPPPSITPSASQRPEPTPNVSTFIPQPPATIYRTTDAIKSLARGKQGDDPQRDAATSITGTHKSSVEDKQKPNPAQRQAVKTTQLTPTPPHNHPDQFPHQAMTKEKRRKLREEYIFSIRAKRAERDHMHLKQPEKYYRGEKLKDVKKTIVEYQKVRWSENEELREEKWAKFVAACGLVPPVKAPVELPDYLKD